MAVQLAPYLSFVGRTREALEFYQSVLGGEVTISTFGDFGGTDPETADLVMHGTLRGPVEFFAADDTTLDAVESFDGVSMAIFGDAGDLDTIKGWYDALGEGGTVLVPFDQQVWGDAFGGVKDRYGVPWWFNVAAAPAAS